MTAISGASSYAGYLRHLYQLTPSSSVSAATTDSDGDGDSSPASSTSTGGASALTGTGSPLSLLSNDLQGLLTALQDVSNSDGSAGITPASLNGASPPAGGPAAQVFAAIDTDGSGSISQSEWEAGAPQGVTTAQADQAFQAIDTNGDGSISPSELQNAVRHGGHHGHHHGQGGASTSNLTDDINGLLKDLQQTSSDSSSDPLTASTDSSASGNTGSNGTLNDQFAKMLADLKTYLQDQGPGTVQVSA